MFPHAENQLPQKALAFWRQQFVFDRCREILASVEDAERAVTLAKATPSGRFRIQMPVGFGRRVAVPALRRLAQKNPGLVIDVELSDRGADLAYEGVDAAIQIGQVRDERLVARTLCRFSRR